MSADAGFRPTIQPAPLLRPRYFPRQLVTDADLTADQAYVDDRLRRANRLLHGYGVVCGLDVLPHPATADGALTVTVTPGFALGPQGDEIEVPAQRLVPLDCVENLVPDCFNSTAAPGKQRVYVVLHYAEAQVKPIPALPSGCDQTAGCEPSRVQAGFAFECRAEPPARSGQRDCAAMRCESLGRTPPETVAGAPALFACPPGSTETGVVLAAIDLSPRGDGIAIEIDYSVRAQLLSTQHMLEWLRCRLSEPPPAISAIEPWSGSQGSTIDEVAIVGAGLGGATAVTFSGVGIQAVMLREPFARLRQVSPNGDIVFSPDSRLIASAAAKQGVQLWDAASGRLRMTLAEAFDAGSVAFSPDGSHLAARLLPADGTGAGESRIWDLADRGLVTTLPYASQLTYSPAGRYVYLAGVGDSDSSRVEIRRAVDGELVTTIAAIAPELVVSPDGRLLLTLGRDGIQVWETRRGALLRDRQIRDVVKVKPIFSSDGRRIVAVDSAGTTVSVADAMTGVEIHALSSDTPVAELTLAPNGRLVVMRDVAGALRLWDPNEGGELPLLPYKDPVAGFALSPDGRFLAVALDDQTVRLWDLGVSAELALLPHPAAPQVVRFSPDARTLVTRWQESDGSTTAGLWPVESPATCALVRLTIAPLAPTGERNFQVVTPCGVVSSAQSGIGFRVEPGAGR